MRLRTFLSLLATLSAFALHAAEAPPAEGAAPPQEPIVVTGVGGEDIIEIDIINRKAIATKGPFVATYSGAVLTADQLSVDQDTGEAFAKGNVVLVREGGQLWSGDQLSYNFKTRVLGGKEFKTGQPPYFATGENLITNPTNNSYIATNGMFTTDDNPQPNYRLRAKKIIITPGKSIEARHAVLYVGSMPVFYYPYFHKDLGRHPNNFELLPGYRSSWGPFLLTSYNWYWDKHLHGAVNMDARGERGIAGGPDLFFRAPSFGEAMLRYYVMKDQDPRSEPGYEETPSTRQRVLFTYDATLRTNLTVKGVAAYQSDPLIVRDFFESEYHDNVQPKTFLEVDQNWPNWSLNLLTQPRLNDYQETVERLPDLKLMGLRQQLGPTPLYYESESSVGYFRHLFPDMETNKYYPIHTNEYAATRADTFHQILLPWTFFNFLNVTPRVGDRVTYYGEANGRGTTTEEESRNVFNTGGEVTWKASRVYRDTQNDLLDVSGLRHIIEPSVNYVYVPEPGVDPRKIPQFDTSLPSSRLLPIDFPEFNSIDAIDSQQTLRFGVRNRLQTKREGEVDELLNWALYADWHMSPHQHQTTFSDFYSDMVFKPRSWITFDSQLRYDSDRGQFNESLHQLTIQPGSTWSIQLGHLYRDTTPELGLGNNLIRATLFYRLNENWAARISEYFEARDGVLEYQYYTIYRDFRSWTGGLTLRMREDHDGSEDYTVAFTFSLKASPSMKLGNDAVRPQRLIGG
jgi:LPS-assembly protein